MPTATEVLDNALQRATSHSAEQFITDTQVLGQLKFVCRNIQNRAGIRLLLACLLAKVHRPQVDIRKPYTEIGGNDSYSGRTYDEVYLGPFINKHQLPCNPTTAFLTPALRNRNTILTPDIHLVGRPPKLYQVAIQLLTDVYLGKVAAEDLLTEAIRCLLVLRDEKRQWIHTVREGLKSAEDSIPLAAEAIVVLVEQHLKSRGASRLPVLIVAAAYTAAAKYLGEQVLPLKSHNAADEQTGAIGDIEITLTGDEHIVTSYEMKMKRVTKEDIDRALQKINNYVGKRIDNYIFITTDVIEIEVKEYAASMYDQSGGMEVVILDCVSFLRHFLHLFHRLRMQFLEIYQELVLAEPESAVSQPLKEVFLALRQVAESIE